MCVAKQDLTRWELPSWCMKHFLDSPEAVTLRIRVGYIFTGIVSRLMRQVLVDTARQRAAQKRAAGQEIGFADVPDWAAQPSRSVLAINDGLKQLEKMDPIKAEIIQMS